MSWAAVIGAGGAIGGSAISGLMGGDAPSNSDIIGLWQDILYGQDWRTDKNNPAFGDGLMPSMMKDIRRTEGMYKNMAKGANRFKKQEIGIANRQIGDWQKNTSAQTGLGLASRGLYNTTVLDSQNQNIGQAAQRMKTDARVDIGSRAMNMANGYRIAGNGAGNDMRQNLYGMMMQPGATIMGMNASMQPGMMQAAGKSAGGWGNLATSLIGGMFPGGAPGANSGGQSIWSQLGGLFGGGG